MVCSNFCPRNRHFAKNRDFAIQVEVAEDVGEEERGSVELKQKAILFLTVLFYDVFAFDFQLLGRG